MGSCKSDRICTACGQHGGTIKSKSKKFSARPNPVLRRSRETFTRNSSSHHLPSLPFSPQRRRGRPLSAAVSPLISVLGCVELCFSVARALVAAVPVQRGIVHSVGLVRLAQFIARCYVLESPRLLYPQFHKRSSLKTTSV